ncbi:MAG: 4'-phosphopantetheinyl transferase superfamily protein [Lachnospiraceae bacterium]|nr:4'-phosphopantetheinyl transferase superfamily protein [Lachnospiraceae bacterium]
MADDVSYSVADIRRFLDEDFENFYNYISEDRKKRADSMKLSNDRKLSILASFQLERLLEGMGISKPFRYTTLPGGKPVLEGEDVFFSISHSGNFAAAVVSDKYSVGIDVEDLYGKKRDPKRLKSVAEKFFLPEEVEFIEKAKENENRPFDPDEGLINQGMHPGRIETFYRIWTMKEAYMKAIGKPLLEVFREKKYDENDVALTQKHSSEAVFSIYRVVPEK